MKKEPIKIGITGGIGTGKSVVSNIFQVLKVPCYNADIKAKSLMVTNPQLVSDIKNLLGEEAYENEKINRTYISKVIFNDPLLLQKMNNYVHPAVQKDFLEWIGSHDHHPYILKEAALLFETGSYASLDKIITVSSPLSLRIVRLKQRDVHRNREQILSIVAQQLPEEEKVKRADFVIYNDEKQFLMKQVLSIHSHFMALANS